MDNSSFTHDKYGKTRILYIIEACVENFISVLITGAYLATLTLSLGISDSLTAVLSSIISLSYLFQVVSIYLAHKKPVKRWVLPIQLIAHIMFASIYLLPVLNIKRGASIILFMLLLGGYTLKSVIQPIKLNWFYSLVSPKKRGTFTAVMTAISVIGQMLFTLFASGMFDYFVNSGNERGAFISLTITMFILIVMDIIPLFFSKEKPEEEPIKKAESPFKSVSLVIKNKRFVYFLIIGVLSSLASGILVPFLYTYQINELGFSLSFIAIIEMIVNIVRVGALFLFGRVSAKRPSVFMLRLSAAIRLISIVLVTLSSPINGAILFTLYRIFSIIEQSASAIGTRNLEFELVEDEHRTSAISIYTIATGLSSFLVTLAVTPLVSSIQANGGITIFGISLYAQQFLGLASLGLVVILNIFTNICYKKLKVETTE